MMINFKRKATSFFDTTDSNLSIKVNVAVALLTFCATKFFGANILISLFICISVVSVIGAIFQVVRKDRKTRLIILYIFSTLFSILITIIIWLLDKYSYANNGYMIAKMVEIIVCTIAVLFDISGIYIVLNKNNSKGKRVLFLICMIYFTLLAVAAILFFISKGV